MKKKPVSSASLRAELAVIKARNARVEEDKAWETSTTRKCIIAVLTYLVIVLFFIFAHVANPWLNAIVPAIGFVLSTLSLPLFKRVWLRYRV
jgi:hypothetical protein